MGGSDQWGNITTGTEPVRRMNPNSDAKAFALTTPLITKADGSKFGKSEGGNIWLDADKTSVYKFYQFWLNVDDESAADYLKIYTLLSREEIEKLEAETKNNPAARQAQKTLAYEVTKIVHGETKAKSAKKVTEVLFGSQDASELSDEEQATLVEEIPVAKKGSNITEILTNSSVAASKGEARRLLEAGAISVNGQKITDDKTVSEVSLIKKGKNQFVLIR